MKILRFVKASPPYNVGEIAGFDDAKAAGYITARIAVEHEDEPSPPPPPAPPAGDPLADELATKRKARAAELEELTKDDLIEFADEVKAETTSKMTKAELVEAILAKEFPAPPVS